MSIIELMKLPSSAVLLGGIIAASLAGCATPPVAPTTTAAKPAAPKAAVASTTAAPTKVAEKTATISFTESLALPKMAAPVLPPEVAAMVEHLTQTGASESPTHEVADTTGFPEAMASLAPGAQAPKVEFIDSRSQPPPKGLTADGNSTALVEHDWTGLVLVPISTSLSKAYTSAVRLLKVEAHPLRDGRVRIWIRVQNIGRDGLAAEVACAFRMQGETTPLSPYFYELEVPTRAYRDVFFVSPEGKLNTYTVLVRPSRAN